ncbi:MAG: HAMP domain-containing sensor histidine kinase [Bacteroidales bacterium]|nr:HAMP domain-containing sensor histidine kinase [Bacteroidales bacterium]
MDIYRRKTIWKFLLLIFAVIIGLGSLLYTNKLVKDLKNEERKKAELLARTWRRLINSNEDEEYVGFLFSIIENNSTIPVILTDENHTIIGYHNFDSLKTADPEYMQRQLARLREKSEPIIIDLGKGSKNYIYYKDSIILTSLIYYPSVQLAVIIMFIMIAYIAFSMSRRAEQNSVWVGMSKETAHQLGTPTSSLSALSELIKDKYPGTSISEELNRDVERLEKITERFSRIGSVPALTNENIVSIISRSLEYLKLRSSSKIKFRIENELPEETMIPLNTPLFEWVMENVCKNAIDAMNGEGIIRIKLSAVNEQVIIDIIDTGKGIPRAAQKQIFKPGYTTKKRGWGLGLSLAQRIIELYHKGKIYVKYSDPAKGSVIRIILRNKI